MRNALRAAALVSLAAGWLMAGAAAAQNWDCGDVFDDAGKFGAHDYTNAAERKELLHIVENYHFTPKVERLISGETTTDPMSDIRYTLRKWPNHHRALFAMIRYHTEYNKLRRKGWDPLVAHRPPECWFERAIRFKPSDGTVRLLYGMYLERIGDHDGALQRYEEAAATSPNNPEVHYNLGLFYIDRKDYEQAREHAWRAYKLGYPLPGLRNKLKRLGEWKPEPEPAPTPEAESEPASSEASAMQEGEPEAAVAEAKNP